MLQQRLLIIDDEAVIREGLKRIFERESFSVEICSGGYGAIELLHKQEFDLIITDLKMPGMVAWRSSKPFRPSTPTRR